MNVLEDPVPFNSTEECLLADISNSGSMLEPSIAIILQFHPILPIPSIPSIQCIVDKDQLHSWEDKIPQGVSPLSTISIVIHNNSYTIPFHSVSDFLIQMIPNFLTTHPIVLDISYSLTMENSLQNCMKLSESVGELRGLSDSILNHRTNVRPFPPNTIMNSIRQNISQLLTRYTDISLPTYTEELNTLARMGFVGEEVNYRALLLSTGNIEVAVNILLSPTHINES